QKDRVSDSDDFALKLIQKDRELEQIRNQIRDSEAKAQLASVEVKRYTEENTNLKGFIGDRDKEIVKLNFAIRDLTKDKEDLKNYADSMQLRASSLIDDLRQARQKLAEMETQLASGAAGTPLASAPASVKDPTQANPPPRMVRGEIEKIHAEDNKL